MKSLNKFTLLISALLLGSFVNAATTAYTYSNHTLTSLASSTCSSTDDANKLKVKPSYYSLKVYSLYVCSSKPYPETMTPTGSTYAPAHGDSFVKDSCHQVFNNTSGSEVEVIDGTSSPLTGTVTRPPNGTYPYYLLKVDSNFKYKAELDFSGADTNGSVSGGTAVAYPYCVTTTGSQDSYNKDVYASCAATSGATPGLLVENKVTLGSGLTATFKRANSNSCSSNTCTDPIGVYITDSSENFIGGTQNSAASGANASGIISIKSFSNPVTFADDTKAMNIVLSSKRAFLVIGNPQCNAGYNSTKKKLKVGGTGWSVDVQTQ